jgi:hypothetical protein
VIWNIEFRFAEAGRIAAEIDWRALGDISAVLENSIGARYDLVRDLLLCLGLGGRIRT